MLQCNHLLYHFFILHMWLDGWKLLTLGDVNNDEILTINLAQTREEIEAALLVNSCK